MILHLITSFSTGHSSHTSMTFMNSSADPPLITITSMTITAPPGHP